MPRRVPDDRKREAVRMVIEGGLSVVAVAEQLGIGKSTIEKAVAKFRENQPEELTISEWEELKRLRRDNAELRYRARY